MLNLETNAPQTGHAADCHEVAQTAAIFERAVNVGRVSWREGAVYTPARHAVTLHRISGRLHRIAERHCNGDLTCRACGGEGRFDHRTDAARDPKRTGKNASCLACAGTGSTLGRRLERLRTGARDIAAHYGLRVYFQADPRGCPLYLIDPKIVPSDFPELGQYRYKSDPKRGPLLATLQDRWIDANYNRGRAVVRIGR